MSRIVITDSMSAEVRVGLIYDDFIKDSKAVDRDTVVPRDLRIGDVKVYIADQLKVKAIPTVREDFRIEELELGSLDGPNMIYYREEVNGTAYDNFVYAYINDVGRQIRGSIRADSKSNLVECHYQHGDLWSADLHVDDSNDNWMMETSRGIELATLTNLQMALTGFQIAAKSDKTNLVSLEINDGGTFMSLN